MSADESAELDLFPTDPLQPEILEEARTGLRVALRGCDPLSVLLKGVTELGRSDDDLELVLLAAFSPAEISYIVESMLADEVRATQAKGFALEEGIEAHRPALERLDALLAILPAPGRFAPLPEKKSGG